MITENQKNIGESIRTARKHAGITQQELAKLIGGTHAAISYWENNVNTPNVLDCWKIADAFNISIDELIGRKM